MFKNWKWKNFLTIVLPIIFVVGFLYRDAEQKRINQKPDFTFSHSEFLARLKNNKIESVVVNYDGTIEGNLKTPKNDTSKKDNPVKTKKTYVARVILNDKILEQLEKNNIAMEIKPPPKKNILADVPFFRILEVFGTVLWIVVLVIMFKSMRGADRFGIAKTNLKSFSSGMQKTKFSDVLGIDEAKEDVKEIVDFLSDPEKYSRLGAKIPKGILLVGSPGTGKTLLAKAIAGEAGVPFFSTSGSEFVEMFVGVGASRVRSLFEQASKNAPCLVFIDEIDAVGRHRGSGYGGGNDEREQTLNQLLVEMDGFESNKGIVIIAATNRVDVLDSALLRAGRFDRQVYIDLPDLKGRTAILTKYMNEVKILSDVDPLTVARGTPGFSGADLANLVNEAALLAARFQKKKISKEDFEYARDKILMGSEKKSKTMTEQEIKNTAYHEAGHALCAVLLPQVDPIHKATIVPRGRTLGLVQKLPEHDKVSVSITEIKSDIAVAMAGRICEELFFGAENATTGASSDLEFATNYARNAVIKWGFSNTVGHVCYKNTDDYTISEQTQREIDLEVKNMLEQGYKLAYDTIIANKDKVENIAKALIEYETLTGDEVRSIVSGNLVKFKKEEKITAKPFVRNSSLPITEVILKPSINTIKENNEEKIKVVKPSKIKQVKKTDTKQKSSKDKEDDS